MSEERMAAIAARERAATAGPWKVRPWNYDDWGFVRGEADVPVCSTSMSFWYQHEDRGKPEGPSPIPENAEFIAHARSDIPWLMERVRELEAEIERLKGETNV